MIPTGGLRERLIGESVHQYLRACLTELGWLTSDRTRRDVHYLGRPAADGENIELNTLAVFSERVRDTELEMGSGLTENAWQWYADIYAGDEALGVHLSGDVRDILRGKMPSVGAGRPVIPVLDFTMATPVPIFSVQIENVTRDRAPSFTHAWQQFWFMVPFDVVDDYDTEVDPSS
jgi:hypothetical protein